VTTQLQLVVVVVVVVVVVAVAVAAAAAAAAAASVVVVVIKHGCSSTYLLLQKTDWNLTQSRCSPQIFQGP
jgi:presenilin-like A22 family membrane protease